MESLFWRKMTNFILDTGNHGFLSLNDQVTTDKSKLNTVQIEV